MKVSIKASNIAVNVTDQQGATLAAVSYTDYNFELDVAAIINEVGSLAALVETVKARVAAEINKHVEAATPAAE